ncbi:MAG: aminomethyl-transferring glycine dehydrogenase subunit GcvPA [Chloroflexi bacterium]|nr:aminomethyl-transferring glycine dehydrogenase subunit GcvPA [Chloroflexota bacterium]
MSTEEKPFVHPYIPNSAPEVREEMLKTIGVGSDVDLYREVPDDLRLHRKLDIPAPFVSEFDLRKHIEGLLAKNKNCNDYVNFLGAGCWQHFVPAVCDEINGRGEFVTAYAGHAYTDHGKYQATFEAQSMIGELIGMDAISFPTYDWSTAAGSSLLMAARIAGRKEVLVPRNLNPDKKMQMNNFCRAAVDIVPVEFDPKTGLMDLNDLKSKISAKTACVYFENPSYLGVIEANGAEISRIAHENGAQSVVGVDTISLGVLAPPSDYGADIVCGELQPLGMHMQYGGGLSGFVASRDEVEYLEQSPSFLVAITKTQCEGEWGYGWAQWENTSYVQRDQAKDFTGTTTALWVLTAGVYLALMGPQGMREVGETIISKAQYAMGKLAGVKGVTMPLAGTPFKEFVVNFDGAGKTVKEINKALLGKGIFGGKDLSKEYPQFGQSALYCVTEVISKDDIDKLAESLQEVVK